MPKLNNLKFNIMTILSNHFLNRPDLEEKDE